MVIQCTQCNTRFKIADEKLKPGGIKVRCSKCRNIFKVMPPEPEKPTPPGEEEIDFGAFNMEPVPEEPTTSEAIPQPDVTEREKPEEAGSGTGIMTESTPQGPAEFDFEKEPPRRGPEEFDFAKEPSRQGPAEFDFEEESSGQGPAEFDFEESPSGQGPLKIDFEDESATPESEEFGFEDEGDTGRSLEFSFDEMDPFSEREFEDEGETETGTGAPEDFEFGDEANESATFDDFDLSRMSFGDEEPAPREEDAGSISMERAPEAEGKPALPHKSRQPAGKAEKVAAPAAIPRRKSPFKGLQVFVLILLLALCGVAGYFFWQRDNLDIVKIVEQLTGQGSPAGVAGQIHLSDLSSSFVTNRETGQLFVIQGKATNDYPEARSAIAVKGIVYDKKGQSLLQQTVFCGNHLNDEALRSIPFAKIEESMNNQFGDSLSNLNVGPGKSIPFTIVFKNLPPDLAEYTVETVDSKPGSKP